MAGEHRFRILEAEMNGDPLARVYSGMTDIQVADDINTNERAAPEKNAISAEALWNATVQVDFENLPVGPKAEYNQMLSIGNIDVSVSSKARTDLEAMFAATGSLTSILALYSGQTFFRWQEIGLPGPVAEGHVADVRR